jgi:outer membrane protein TolC
MNERMRGFIIVICLLAALPARAETNTTRSLTLRECVELALANNLDIQIERINPGIASLGVVREQAAFDPVLTGSASYEDSTRPTGAGQLTEKQLEMEAGLGGLLPTGARYSLFASDARTSGTLTTNFTYTGTAGISLAQPLLRNFGPGANTALIRAARKSRQIAAHEFAGQVISTVTGVNNAYYELVFAIEDHKAKLEDLNRAKALLADNRRRVEVGVMSPLDVTQAEAGVAEREEAVIVAERVIRDRENSLKRLISRDVMAMRGVTLVPVDYPRVEMVEIDAARSIATALLLRPELLRAKEELERRNILVKYNRNQWWPEVDLEASYALAGRGDTFGRFADSVGDADNPAWAVGVVVSVPLGNRQARANYRISRLQAEQALLSLKRAEQEVIVEADNAARLVQSNLKRVEATRAASRLAEESLKAEEHKLRAGASTSFLVLQAQAQLAAARSSEIRARADYAQSIAELARAEGTTLEKHNILLEPAP